MSKKLAKEKRKLYIMIMAVLLVVCFIISGAYAVIRYKNEKQQLLSSAEVSFSNLISSINQRYVIIGNQSVFGFTPSSDELYTVFHLNEKENSQIEVKNSSEDVIARSDNVFIDYFTLNRKDYVCVWISHEDFCNCLTQEQYKKITDYLNDKPEEENSYYELLCTEFYVDKNGLHPIMLELVKTNEYHDWYVEDEVIEKFSLNAIVDEDARYYKSGEMDRNVIATDFILNGGNDEDLIGNRPKAQILYEQLENESLIQTDTFSYIYYNEEHLYSPPVDGEDNECITVKYAERLDVLESCQNDILTAAVIIFLFFIITGIILWIMTWQIIKNQALQEQKRREITDAMAHDLKTPLFVISGYAQNLKENIYSEKREYYADMVLKQTESVNALVHRMLELSKLDSVNFKPNIESFDLTDLTDEVLENYKSIPDGKTIEFVHGGKCEIRADRELIKRALENLIDNAVKYSEKEKCITVEIKGNAFYITNFCGNITKSQAEQFWEPYYRQDKNSRADGNGLGLSIVKSILELHKFKYDVRLKDGKITFLFTF